MKEEILNFDDLSRIQVAGRDTKITNQDARKIFVASKGSEYKRTSDFMLANDGKELHDAVYVSVEDFTEALQEALEEHKEVKKVVMKKTGKVVPLKKIEEIIETAKKAGKITLQENFKIENQTAKMVSVKTNNMQKSAPVAGMMLGKNGPKLTDGDYVNQADLEFTVIKKEKIVVDKKKIAKVAKGLSSIAVGLGLIALLPWIMHANSVTWHHVGPEIQEILHAINLGLGKLINADYIHNSGLWELTNGNIMNADAASASLAGAVGVYGLTSLGLAKITMDIKNGILTLKKKLSKEEQEKMDTNEELSGGKNL